ncbi:ABC transporter ATP-binding protein [Halodesulfurarchaeum sp.]|uniref:ABC transporter ATP-binding protein n=1 Tax=Halodesulfurarchaeum sp. TaxID=1980530 RepID=UPI001BBE312F|nr:sn-glycerol-3-phosphate ABC transporter ATP-binding protein UgpC [Halodesulfurarchaeum sp.]
MAADSETRVSLERATKDYGSVVAVKDIDLEIEPGEFVVIVGPSGCGKSTTLRMIAGLEELTEGDLYFDDRRMNAVEPKDRNVAMVFQNYALYPHMTARRNMVFGMNAGGQSYSSEEIEARVSEAAEVLGITDLLDRKPKQLSGGERQRVALGRSLVRDPDVLLLDEPLSNLDAKLRIQMRTELRELHHELGTTTVYVTHDQTEAMTLGDKVVVMEDGEIQQVDPPTALYDFPENQFVADFIGEPPMNMLPVEIRETDGGHVATFTVGPQDFRLPLPGTDGPSTLTGTDALLGVRPGDIHRADPDENEPGTVLELTVDITEPLGESLLVHGRAGDQEVTVELDAHAIVSKGETISLGFDQDRLHLFDPADDDALYHSAEPGQDEA